MSELNKHRNHGLFSDYYLNELLPQRVSEWQDHALVQKAFTQIKSLHENLKSSLPQQSESQLEEKFIKKILTILGHVYEVQPTLVSTAAGMKKPDYALFPNRQAQESVQNVKGKTEFFKQVLAIAEAKKWERPLDKEIKHIEDKDNPSLQMDRYLYYTEVPWGILTNGRYWRLYNRKTSKELDNYFEVDLRQVLEAEDIEAFKYFYFFFRREAFPEFVEQVYQGSVDYAKELGDNLKENVYEALKILARGFLKTPRNNLDPEKNLKEIHDNCLILLYRIIFLLYAESPRRGERLLPLDDPVYQKQYSIYALKNKVRNSLTLKAELSPIKATLWSELKALFALVNQGSESMGIPKNKFFVPAYNGGLFDEREHEFLEKYVIADLYLAQAIDLLARTPVRGNHEKAFVDYGSLQIRHLGSIYEGLLEYKLGIAKEKMVAISEKGKQKWVKASEAKGKKAIEEVEAGDVYLYTDKGERKATGSYYTPDYIVDYIVQNTLGPILEDLKKQVNGNSTKLIDAILNLKVLDPAMGSGHFLVAATDYLARALVEALGESEKELEEDDIRWARREIVERCIFGVDLNPLAVELAKLSLWLATVSKNKPLSFLDHHLRCGNSLIGATIKNLADLPELGKKKKRKKGTSQQLTLFEILFKKEVNELLKDFERIESLPSETVEQIRDKEKLYEDFRRKVDRFKIVADLWTSRYFGNELGWSDYNALQEGLKDEENWQELAQKEWFQKGVGIAEEKHFFHWELEFPEVFFGTGKEPGFDAVIGNPPYVRIQTSDESDKTYISDRYTTAIGSYDVYVIFVEKSLDLLNNNGHFCFIMPNKFINVDYGYRLREIATKSKLIERLVNFGDNQIFPPQTTYTCLFFLTKSREKFMYYEVQPLREVDKELPPILANLDDSSKVYKLNVTTAELAANAWHFFVGPTGDIFRRLSQVGPKLADIVERDFQGVATSDDKVYILEILEEKGDDLVRVFSESLGREIEIERDAVKPLFKGSEISRYYVADNQFCLLHPYKISEDEPHLISEAEYKRYWPRAWKYLKENEQRLRAREHGKMNHDQWYAYIYPKNLGQFESSKILTQVLSREPAFSLDTEGKYFFVGGGTAGAHGLTIKDSCHLSLYYVLALLNSRLLDVYFDKISTRFRGGYRAYTQGFTGQLPVRSINFTTPQEERTRLVKQLIGLYANNSFRQLLEQVDMLLPKDQQGNFLAFKEGATGAEEKSDVIHDLLAYLAEQMIEMNKQKNQEIKGFLAWLENYLGAKIDDLKNKTKIREYHEGTIELLLEVLDQNRKAITKINIQGREAREQIKTEFEKSMAKLKPLKDRIEATDKLIDQIVYKLYGLTDEEIKIVEESLSSQLRQTEDVSPEDD